MRTRHCSTGQPHRVSSRGPWQTSLRGGALLWPEGVRARGENDGHSWIVLAPRATWRKHL
eukprot:4297747-Prymnesium_polylepis.1